MNKPPNQVDTHANLVPGVFVSQIAKGDKNPEEASFIYPMKKRFNDATTSDDFAEKLQAVGFFARHDNNSIEENVAMTQTRSNRYNWDYMLHLVDDDVGRGHPEGDRPKSGQGIYNYF